MAMTAMRSGGYNSRSDTYSPPSPPSTSAPGPPGPINGHHMPQAYLSPQQVDGRVYTGPLPPWTVGQGPLAMPPQQQRFGMTREQRAERISELRAKFDRVRLAELRSKFAWSDKDKDTRDDRDRDRERERERDRDRERDRRRDDMESDWIRCVQPVGAQ